nr:retrovirus-related Pol polyprotein from transposon TNT 1-94 [Tanacetum cinerariifolium]
MMNEMIRNNLTVATMQVNVQFLQQLQPEWSRYKGKEIAKPITPPSESAFKEDNDPEQAQRDKNMQKNLALIAKYFKKIYKPTNNLKTSSNSRNKNVDTTPRYKNDNQSGQFGNQRTMNVVGARENVGSLVVQQSGIQCFNCKEFGHFAKEWRKPKRVKDFAYHKEKMLLCKQAEKGELEAHYSYMAKIQAVPTADPGIDYEPLEHVKNDTGYNVFANDLQHSEQSESVSNTCLVETDDSNVFPDSQDMCNDDIQNDQNDVESDEQTVNSAWIKHSKDQFRAPTAQDMEILIQTCLMPLALKTQNDSFIFVHELKQEMHADLKYVESLKKEIDELESDKAEFSNMYDVILQECVSNDVMCSYLLSLSDLDALAELQCLYLHKVKECDCLAQKLSNQNLVKNDTIWNKQASNVFQKEREQYIKIQDLKAQMQDKNIAISELKKLIENGKGKYVETKFDKPSIVRQPNAQRIPKPSVLGKLAPFSNSFERRYFLKIKSVPKANVSEGLSKPVTTHTLPQTARKDVSNTNVLRPGMYRLDNRTTQTRAPQLPQTVRNTNPRVSTSTGVNHKTNVSRPHHKSNQLKDKVLANNSQVKPKKTQVEEHPRILSITNKIKSVTTCNDSLNSRTLNVNTVCATCGKCLVDSNHFACVTKMLNDVNARTKKPNIVPISTRKPKGQANKSVATPHKKKVASKSINQKPHSYFRMLYEKTSNLQLLCNFVEKFLGTVRFDNDQFAPILSYEDLVQGNIMINMVYYVEGLNHNLFLVGQFCDADLEVAFRKSTCFVRDLQGNDLLTGNHGSDLYTIFLQESTSSTPLCLMAKASPTQAWLWHQILSHLNFDYINLLSRKDIVIGLPKLKFVKDQLCSSCELNKAKRSSFKSKDVPSSKGRLNLLHMNLCGPMRVASINGKKYIMSKGYHVYNKRTRMIVESIHIRFDEIKEVSETSVANDTSGIVPQRQKASDCDNSDPVPQIHNVSSLEDAHVPSQQELDLLFGPLYDEFFTVVSNPQDTKPTTHIQSTSAPSTPTYVYAEENNDHQAEEEHLQDDEFTNPFCTLAQEVAESSSHNIEQVRRNPSRPVQTRRQLAIDPEICMFALTVSTTEPKNIKEAVADSAWIEAMQKEIHQFDRLQAKYALEILHKHGMEKGQSIGTPMATKPKLDADLSGNPIDQTDYRSKIRSLMYLTSSRLDIVQAVCFCVRYQSRPTEKHLKEVKRIFRYLRGTVNMGLWYPKGSSFGLTAFSDADHVRCIDTRKSTSGGIQFLGDKLVSWMPKKQNFTVMSSAEAEYVALSASCAQVMWMRTQLQDYGFNYNKIPLYCDSQSAIAISCNPVQHSRTKHIHTRYHFIKEQVKNGIIELYFVRTEYQLADMFTKALPEDRFKYIVR